jgi:hypothetical protein
MDSCSGLSGWESHAEHQFGSLRMLFACGARVRFRIDRTCSFRLAFHQREAARWGPFALAQGSLLGLSYGELSVTTDERVNPPRAAIFPVNHLQPGNHACNHDDIPSTDLRSVPYIQLVINCETQPIELPDPILLLTIKASIHCTLAHSGYWRTLVPICCDIYHSHTTVGSGFGRACPHQD